MNESRNQQNKDKTSVNFWKWAFLSLVSLIMIGLFFFVRAIQPVSIQESAPQETSSLRDELSLVSTITTEDAEVLMNQSIEAMLVDQQLFYEVTIDNQLEIRSTVDILTFEVPYTLYLDPYATDDGNLQLRANAIELGNFSLPVSVVLSLLANEMDLPFFIKVDSDSKIILIDFNELSTERGIGIVVNKIDLENNEIQLKLSVSQATLIEALNFDSK